MKTGAGRLTWFDSGPIFLAALAFYWWTLAPTVVWGDSADLARRARLGSLELATAGQHPLFVLVSRVFALLPGELARNVNLESAVFGALAVVLVYRCCRLLGAGRPAALVGAVSLCVSHAFWLHAVIAEVYTANAFFLLLTLYLLLRWRERQHPLWLTAAGIALVVGLTNHLVLATMIPASVAFVILTGRQALFNRRTLLLFAAATAAMILAVSVVGWAPLVAAGRRFWYGPPGIGEYLNWGFDAPRTAVEGAYYGLYFVYQFPSVSVALVLVGIWTVLREQRAAATLLLLTIAVNATIFVRHTVWPSAQNAKFVFYIADYAVFAILCGVGAQRAIDRLALGTRRSPAWIGALLLSAALMPPALYAIAPAATKAAGRDLLHARRLPYRDNDRYFLNPNKRGEYGARIFAEESLRLAKPGAVIFADYTPYTVLQYLKVIEGQREDVALVTSSTVSGQVRVEWMFDRGQSRPAYIAALTADYDLSELAGEFDLVPRGPMLEICPR